MSIKQSEKKLRLVEQHYYYHFTELSRFTKLSETLVCTHLHSYLKHLLFDRVSGLRDLGVMLLYYYRPLV